MDPLRWRGYPMRALPDGLIAVAVHRQRRLLPRMTTNRSGGAAVAAALGRSGGGPWPQWRRPLAAVAVSRCVIRVELPESEGRIVGDTEARRVANKRKKDSDK